jgi:hypothetical protein
MAKQQRDDLRDFSILSAPALRISAVVWTAPKVHQAIKEHAMKILSVSAVMLAALFAASTKAQPMPPGPPAAPLAEEAATIPGLTTAQQAEVRKILIQRRDAQDAEHIRLRAEFDALRVKERNERERIDEQNSEQLHKLLGDDGYRQYAQWDLAHRRPPRPGREHPAMAPHAGRDDGRQSDAAEAHGTEVPGE